MAVLAGRGILGGNAVSVDDNPGPGLLFGGHMLLGASMAETVIQNN